MEIHTIHNPKELKILRTKCAPFDFKKYTKAEIRTLVTQMRKKMHEWHGIGLAATQIGRTESFFVAQPPEGKFYAIFNPEITKMEGGPILMDEGCLSIPNQFGETPRFEKITIEGQNQNGKPIKLKAWGLLAHILQHETDHLLGKLYIDTAKSISQIPAGEQAK